MGRHRIELAYNITVGSLITIVLVLLMIAEVYFYYVVISDKIIEGQELQIANRAMLENIIVDMRENQKINKDFSNWFVSEINNIKGDIEKMRSEYDALKR